MTDHQAKLRDFQPQHSYFVGIDSDGCTFDTMELKHKECFIPNTIRHYELQAVSKYAREAAEFVNLYSKWRGINRFPALVMSLELLAERPEVQQRGLKIKDYSSIQKFIDSGKPLGNPSLKEEIEATGDPQLSRALEWSEAVNQTVADMVYGVTPFPYVKECLQEFSEFADMMCVSATPVGALTQEWEEHGIAQYVSVIAGQEVGSKKATLKAASERGYDSDKFLMIGDAPGDMNAARDNDALFYPIVPGEEEASWKKLADEALPRFRDRSYAGEYEDQLVEYFLKKLPDTPPWKSTGK